MTTVSQPNISISLVPAQTPVSNAPQKVLFVGQKTAQGSAVSGQLIQNILNDNSWNALFGTRSMLAGMIRAGRLRNQETRFDAIPLDDNGTTNQAQATIQFGGTATAAGNLTFYLGSQKDYAVTLPVVVGETAAQLATKLVPLVTALTTAPFTGAAATDTVTLTAANGGTEANNIGLAFMGDVAGVTVTITKFAGGSGDPDVSNVFDAIANERYQTIVWPQGYGLDEVRDLLGPRFNMNNKIMDGIAITTYVDTTANLLTAGNALNDQNVVIKASKLEDEVNWKGPDIMEIPYIRSAQFGSIRALRLTQDADISQYVIAAGGPMDAFGGPAIASLPYFNTALPDLRVSPPSLGFTDVEIEQLFNAGISVDGANVAGNAVISGEVVTTYKTDNAGNPDVSFKFLNYVDTSSNAREYMFNNMRQDFAQSRLTTGDVLPNRNMHNENTIRARIIAYYTALSSNDFALLQAGDEALDFFTRFLRVTIDVANGRVTINMRAPLVTQLRTVVSTFQLAFELE